ncbi:Phosphoglucosamine mutase [Candidatus Desulfarcum epimagneticum]|uniref:Phosphoglucosamine mutase n=1 Tax=uncultured Desulfobacteraceae bacterium TaxID=218296 RepID=A0A484HLI2_9BACT|nr:Phosphoglucosamine mutase [uncultured Desulfobacteraceae bacterium]
MRRLFGTDGIRGPSGRYPVTAEMGVKIGMAAALWVLERENPEEPPMIVVGRDTRLSGRMLEHALAAGICAMGVHAGLVGALPTPGVALMTASMKEAGAGIVISASHNVYSDNGFKFFDQDGFKLTDEVEFEIEKKILDKHAGRSLEEKTDPGRVFYMDDAVEKYADFICGDPKLSLKQTRIVLDCANGAAFQSAGRVFSRLGAEVVDILGVHPDGKNINEGCGSQSPGRLARAVVEKKADAGLAFDGDGDRVVAVDEKGNVLSGDQVIWICARDLFKQAVSKKDPSKKSALQKNKVVVTTVMSNAGLGRALEGMGVRHVASKVGDRHVLEEMRRQGAVLGGEDSGHIIFLDRHTTGDGILAGARLLKAMSNAGRPLSELAGGMRIYPQSMVNVEVREKIPVENVPAIADIIEKIKKKLGPEGRILVRYSGTEPCMRIMAQGPSKEETDMRCREIADIVKKEIGK